MILLEYSIEEGPDDAPEIIKVDGKFYSGMLIDFDRSEQGPRSP